MLHTETKETDGIHDQTCSPSAILVLACSGVASFPGPRPASRHLTVQQATGSRARALKEAIALVSKYILMTKVCSHITHMTALKSVLKHTISFICFPPS